MLLVFIDFNTPEVIHSFKFKFDYFFDKTLKG